MSLTEPVGGLDVWARIVGQKTATNQLRQAAAAPVHAYLLLGPAGVGTFEAALGFAGLVVAGQASGPALERALSLAVEAKHPDVVVFEPEGNALRVDEATEIIRVAQISPIEGDRKVVIVRGIDSIQEAAIGKLLKVIEEPPESTVFVLLAEHVPPEIVTIASRCVTVEFGPIASAVLEAALVGDGVSPANAKRAAAASGGDLARARILAGDDDLAARADLWRSVPDRLAGNGSVVWELVAQLRDAMDVSVAALVAHHDAEMAALEAEIEVRGERGSGRTALQARHKRELRRQRTDEIRFGLGLLARRYLERLAADEDADAETALAAIQDTASQLVRNPNEVLLLQGLFLRLDTTT